MTIGQAANLAADILDPKRVVPNNWIMALADYFASMSDSPKRIAKTANRILHPTIQVKPNEVEKWARLIIEWADDYMDVKPILRRNNIDWWK